MVTRNHWIRLCIISLKILGWVVFLGGVVGGLAAGIHGARGAPDLVAGATSCFKRLIAGIAAGSVGSAAQFFLAYAFELGLQIEENTRRTMTAVDRLVRIMERREEG